MQGIDRLDVLLHEHLAKSTAYKHLWSVVAKALLSHGQASVERGFSINKEALGDNMSEQTLVALRVIKDYVLSVGGKPTDVLITPELITSAAAAHSRYQAHLEEERKKSGESRRAEKRKHAEMELDQLKSKRKCLEASIAALTASAASFADEAEESRVGAAAMSLIAKSNAMRRSAKEKEAELQAVSKELVEKEKEAKAL